eukprot:gene11727-11871_t
MKVKTLQIVWHTKEPVYSIDFHPDGYFATAGGDNDVKIWDVGNGPDGTPQVRFAGSLEGHSCKTVNCVRFSHSGHCLASAGDRGEILLWRPAPQADKTAQSGSPPPATPTANRTAGADNNLAGADAIAAAAGPVSWLSDGASVAWKVSAKLRGHQDDVNDMAWAHDDAVLLSGGVENECVLFHVEKRSFMDRLLGHRHYVQGVSWDPLGHWVVSQSADRTARIYAPKPPGKGSLLALAAGQIREAADKPAQHVTYVYARGHWRHSGNAPPAPVAVSGPGPAQCTPPAPAAAQPQQQPCQTYRLVLAVATLDSVLLYDMETLEAVMLAGPLHYAPITDLAWSRDGSCLAVSSHDGYCSLLTFQEGRVGLAAVQAAMEAAARKKAAAAGTEKRSDVNSMGPPTVPAKRPKID